MLLATLEHQELQTTALYYYKAVPNYFTAKPFRFENYWYVSPGFDELIHFWWLFALGAEDATTNIISKLGFLEAKLKN